MNSGSRQSWVHAAFHRGLEEAGFVEGQNVSVEYRWAEGEYDRLPALVEDLLWRRVAVLVTFGGVHTALAAKGATDTVPIVFANGSDPVKFGLVASLNRPGGNLTGVSFLTNALEAKRFGGTMQGSQHSAVRDCLLAHCIIGSRHCMDLRRVTCRTTRRPSHIMLS